MEVIVNASLRFQGCIDRVVMNPPCQNSFVNLYRFDTNSQRTTTEITTQSNYQPYRGDLMSSRLEQTGEGSVIVVNSFPRPNFSFTYFGIQDVGSYGDVQRLLIYYRVAQGYEEGLVIFPSVALPKEGTSGTNSGMCTCKSNAAATTSLEITCRSDGSCEGNPVCECNPGFQYNDALETCQGMQCLQLYCV